MIMYIYLKKTRLTSKYKKKKLNSKQDKLLFFPFFSFSLFSFSSERLLQC